MHTTTTVAAKEGKIDFAFAESVMLASERKKKFYEKEGRWKSKKAQEVIHYLNGFEREAILNNLRHMSCHPFLLFFFFLFLAIVV